MSDLPLPNEASEALAVGGEPAPAAPRTLDQILGPEPKPRSLDDILNQPDPPAGNNWSASIPFTENWTRTLTDAAIKGWGGSAELKPETVQNLKDRGIFNDYEKGQNSIVRRFNEGLLRPAIAGADILFNRIPGAIHEAAVETPGLGPLAAAMEAFPAGHLTGFPTRIMPRPLPSEAARAEPTWAGTAEPAAETDADHAIVGADVHAASAAANAEIPPGLSFDPTPNDIDGLVRQRNPDLFAEYDPLVMQRGVLSRQLADWRGDALDRIDADIRSVEMAAARASKGREIGALQKEREALANYEGEPPEIAAARQHYLALDQRYRDLAPQVNAAYRDAAGLPIEEVAPAAEAATASGAAPATETAPIPEPAAPAPAVRRAEPAQPPAAAAPSRPPIADIAGHMSRQLVAAGQSQEVADATAAVVEARYRARSANLAGTTPGQLYADEGPRVAPTSPAAVPARVEATPLLPTEENPTLPSPAQPALSIGGGIEALDPATIGVDAARFQFKSGADQAGVTERLEGVEKWDPRLAGTALVWRDEAGANWIADGHQRLALAQRLTGAGQEGIRLNAFVLNAAEGVTEADARAIAAAKNIAEGTGSAIDAAKILREAEAKGVELPPLPPRSALVRDGRALARLGPDAFGMAVNEVVPTGQAAIVGRLVTDPLQQTEAMRVLSVAKPENLRQAEMIVRDVLASGTEVMTRQGGLFGDEEFASSAVLERARVADEAMRQLSRDKTTFGTLVAEAERIEGHGQNQLDLEANKGRLTADEQAKQFLTHLATRKGPVSDALTGIARRVKSGDITNAAAAREFLGVVRRELESGVGEGANAGGIVPGAERELDQRAAPDFSLTSPEAKAGRETLLPGLEQTAQGVQRVLPGFERSAAQAAAAREAEAAGKIAPKVPQKEPGGLFGPAQKGETELFQPAYHGSPFQFDKFTLDHIGEGEGAQVRGYGLYFAGAHEVGRYYREALSRWSLNPDVIRGAAPDLTPAQFADVFNSSVLNLARDENRSTREVATIIYAREPGLRDLDGRAPSVAGRHPTLERIVEAIRALDKPGRLYHVELAPAEHEYLDLDAPFAHQSEHVRAALEAGGIVPHIANSAMAFDHFIRQAGRNRYAAAHLFNKGVGELDLTPKDVSERLSAAGIRGSRYRDEGSRTLRILSPQESTSGKWVVGNAPNGPNRYFDNEAAARADFEKNLTHNYVIFDADDVTIKSYEQAKRGSVTLRDGQATIRLMGRADASTAIHEFGHSWLEEMMRDATDERATQSVRDDAATVHAWLGTEPGQPIPTRAHEKFARGFERYMMEGRAPSQALASVFAKFKAWLTQIYQTVTRLKAPITDDIRAVFDRMLTAPDEPTTIVPERAEAVDFGARHESLAERTEPASAGVVADHIREEADQIAAERKPDVHAELTGAGEQQPQPASGAGPGGEVGRDATATIEPDRHAVAAEPAGGHDAAPGATGPVGAGGTEAAPQGGGARPGEPGAAGAAGANVDTARGSGGKGIDALDRTAWIDRLNTTEDARDIIRELSLQTQDFRDARFGKPAYQLYHDAKAARQLVEQTSQATADAAAKWAESGAEEDAAGYARASQQLLISAEIYNEIKAGWGRAGHAFQRIDRMEAGQSIADYVKRTTGRTLFQIQQERDLAQALPDAEAKAKFIGDTRATTWQKVRAAYLSYFINNLISGPITHGAYSVGNTNLAIFKVVANSTWAATIDSVREMIAGKPLAERVYWSEIPAQIYGMTRGARDGLGAAGPALKTGVPYMKGADLLAKAAEGEELDFAAAVGDEAYRPQAIPGKAGYVLETPSRAVSAIHTIFYSMGYEQEIARLAVRSAMREGLEGDAYNAQVAEFTQSPPIGAIEAAHDEALAMVLMKRPAFQTSISALQRAVNGNVVAKTIMPFMQIGTNILDQAFIQHTPLAFLTQAGRDDLLGRNGEVARTLRYGKIASGTMVAGVVVGLAAEEMLTGGGPSDPHERMRKELTGWRPYSIRIGDHYFPYRKFLGPIGALVGGVANMYEVAHTAGTGEYAQAASAAIFGLSEVVADETWARGLSDFINAARNWDRDGGRYLRNLGADFVPFAVGVGQLAQLIDPYQREVHSFVDAVKNKIPILRQTLEPRVDYWGEPITGHTMIGPSAAVDDPVNAALIRLDIPIAPITRKVDGVGLNDQQYENLAQVAGRWAKTRLDPIVNGPNFANLTEASQRDIITRTIADSRKQARLLILAQNHDIKEQSEAAKQAYREGASKKQVREMLNAPAR